MYPNVYKKTVVFCSAILATVLCFGCSESNTADTIHLNGNEILYNGTLISTEEKNAIYKSTFVEFHDDVSEQYKDVANTIIHINQGGIYQISGEAIDTQIRVNAPEEEVTLVLNNVNLTCNTAPAILIENAADPQKAGEAGITIALNDNSFNQITASHIAEYTDENGIEIDYDGAISSKVSIKIEGNGTLNVVGDKEGIESQKHLTINGGTLEIVAADDPINASEDGVSVITINDGIINCSVQNGEEGDGIDSNGFIYINGGSVLAQSHSASEDSGLDADLGVIINGGTVCATGNMYEAISEESTQLHAQFYFAEKQKGGVPVVITDAENEVILAYTPINDFTILEFSLPNMVNGATYHLYSGGTITGSVTNGIYTEIEQYKDGTQMGHRGVMQNNHRPIPNQGQAENFAASADGMPPQRPQEKHPNDQQQPSDTKEAPQKPEDFTSENFNPEQFDSEQLPEDFSSKNMLQPPQEGLRGVADKFNQNIPLTADFVIDSENNVYTGIATIE